MAAERKAKESYTELVIRMDENLKGIVKTLERSMLENGASHLEIINSIKELTLHVNHENEMMSARIKYLEATQLKEKAEDDERKKMFKIGITALGVVLSVLTIWHLLGLGM